MSAPLRSMMHRMLLLACGAVCGHAHAANYPDKPVRFIVPFAPAGGTDITARVIGQKISEAWRQTVVIDNRSGAAGNIGMDLAAKSAGDGYTIVLISATHTVNPATHRRLPYDLLHDFAPVSQMTSQPYVLVLHPAVAAKSIKELIAAANSTPAGLTYGSSGTGGLSHLSGSLLASISGAHLIHVPYKGGGPALADVLGGQINLVFATPLESTPHIKTGRIRALAVTTRQRSRAMPELPTVAEAGVPGFEVSGWYGVLAPAATPREIVTRLSREIMRIVLLPEIIEQFSRDGVEPTGSSPAEFTAHIRAEITKWQRVVPGAGIKME